jgi:hypothetical protein
MNRSSFLILGLALSINSPVERLRAQPPMLAAAPAVASGQPELTAAFRNPISVDLKWKSGDAAVQGHLVEYTSSLAEDFVILGIVPKEITTFQHPDLAPQTKYFYRLRPFLGEASPAVTITTGKASQMPDAGVLGDGEPVLDATDAATVAKKRSLRDPATAAVATPADLTATAPFPLSVTLRWRDRANDEEGYLIEAAGPTEAFHVIAFFPADTVGFTIPSLPPETECRFRVRAFFYGPSSNVLEMLTGEDPAGGR